LPKTVTRQRRDCDVNPGPSTPESNTLTTRLPSRPHPMYRPILSSLWTTAQVSKLICQHAASLLRLAAWNWLRPILDIGGRQDAKTNYSVWRQVQANINYRSLELYVTSPLRIVCAVHKLLYVYTAASRAGCKTRSLVHTYMYLAPIRHLGRFIRFCAARPCTQHSDVQACSV